MGTVWLANDEVLARDVAVKEIPRWPAAPSATPSGTTCVCRAMREAQTAARLNLPRTSPRVYDVVEARWPARRS